MREFETLDDLRGAAGTRLGTSDWFAIDGERLDAFAAATAPGASVAHYLTLSLLPVLAAQVYQVRRKRIGINYGLDAARFGAPLPPGARVRAAVDLRHVTDVAGGAQLVLDVTVELEGSAEPACTAVWVTRILT